MKSLILVTAFLVATSGFNAYGQNTTKQHLDSLVNTFVSELRAKGVDTICIFEDCWTAGQPFIASKADWCDTKSVYAPVYLLWKENGKSYLSKKDNCFDFSTAPVHAASIWQYYLAHDDAIKTEKPKPFQISSTVNGKMSVTTISDEHPGHRNLKLIVAKDTITKLFDTFQLEASTKNGSETLTNANYQHNRNLFSKHLVDLLGDFMWDAEKQKLLSRIVR